MENALELLQEDRLSPGFLPLVEKFPGIQHIRSCIQCGTCTGSCPMSHVMEETPRMLIEMIRVGMMDEVLHSKTPWYCASCYSCTVRCPMNVPITEVMLALRSLAIKKRYVSMRDDSPAFYSSFHQVLKLFGRSHEPILFILFGWKTNIFRLVGLIPFALGLFIRGRLGLFPNTSKDVAGLRKLMKLVEEMEVTG